MTVHATAITSRNVANWIGIVLCYVGTVFFPVFVGLYIIFYSYVVQQANIYPGIGNVGFHIHAISGSVYFVLGGLQFYPDLRQNFPVVHRWMGYMYYTMVPFIAVGVIWIVACTPIAGVSSILVTILLLPPWVLTHIYALRAIWIFRDVELHRKLNLIGLASSTSIIVMRPVIIAVSALAGLSASESLAIVLWAVAAFIMMLISTYIYFAYLRPASTRPRLQHSGEMTLVGSSSPVTDGFVNCELTEAQRLDDRTISLTFAISSKTGVVFPPGCHVALRADKVVREYTPIYSTSYSFKIFIRLVSGGQMSSKLSFLGPQGNELTQPRDTIPNFSFYGPLFPLPARFGYLPISMPGMNAHTIIMVGGGTGIIPFLSIARAALSPTSDRTNLRLLCNIGGGEGFKKFVESAIAQFAESTTASLSDLFANIEAGEHSLTRARLETSLIERRFGTDQIKRWIGDGTGVVVWVCGPPTMGRNVRDQLLQTNLLKSEQIFVLGVQDH